MQTITELRTEIPVTALCAALEVARASVYRQWSPRTKDESSYQPRRAHPRKLSVPEEQAVLDHLHSDRFMDLSPAEVWATLLDEGQYFCSLRTMYRILEKHGENQERRKIVRHGQFKKPELLATAPNQIWSWDITKLLGPEKWTYFYLYVILDIFSRYVVGWMVAHRETGILAKELIEESCRKQKISPDQLVIHSDRGSPMKSKPVAFLLADLGVTKSFSRPHVSDDNPFSEAQFKTIKYSPHFPERFGSIQDSRQFCRGYFSWYNQEHKHSALGYHTPEDVHYDRAKLLRSHRMETLALAYAAHPERFVRKPPVAPKLPNAVWINPPKKGDELLHNNTILSKDLVR